SKVYQLLGQCYLASGQNKLAADTWTAGYKVADERGDLMPRDEMGKLLAGIGEAVPGPKQQTTSATAGGPGAGFRRPAPPCRMGNRARQLSAPPFHDEIGQRIHASVCADCWNEWLRNYSIKVINELRLDLSREDHQAQYDRYMLEFLGIE